MLESFEISFDWRTLKGDKSIRVEQAKGRADSPGLSAGFVNSLALHRVSVRVPGGGAHVWGSKWVASREEVDEVWIVTERGSLVPELLTLPNAKLVWSTTPLSRRDESRISVLQAKIWFGLARAGKQELSKSVDSRLVAWVLKDVSNISPVELQELSNLNAKVESGCRCAIVKIPGGNGYAGGN